MEYVNQVTIAKPNWCVPAVLEMVLRHYGIECISQQDIAEQLKITPVENGISHKQWGAHVKDGTLNEFFQANNIPLKENYYPVSHILDELFFVDEIQRILKKSEVSIICGYTYERLFDIGDDVYQHVSIIVGATDDGHVEIIDPGPKNAGKKYVSAASLFDAIRAAKDGLWCIEPVNKD